MDDPIIESPAKPEIDRQRAQEVLDMYRFIRSQLKPSDVYGPGEYSAVAAQLTIAALRKG
jgi:hypothetical protein